MNCDEPAHSLKKWKKWTVMNQRIILRTGKMKCNESAHNNTNLQSTKYKVKISLKTEWNKTKMRSTMNQHTLTLYN